MWTCCNCPRSSVQLPSRLLGLRLIVEKGAFANQSGSAAPLYWAAVKELDVYYRNMYTYLSTTISIHIRVNNVESSLA